MTSHPTTVVSPTIGKFCKCCGSETLHRFGRVPDRQQVLTEIFLCYRCGSFVPDYAEDASGIDAQVAYHEGMWSQNSKQDLLRVAQDLQTSVVDKLRDKSFLRPPEDLPTIVEIGAGRGCLLSALESRGYKPFGCEPSAHLTAAAKNAFGFSDHVLNCCTGEQFVSFIIAQSIKLDVVFLWHVLEHLEAPIDLMKKIVACLAEEGLIVAQVPMLSPDNIFPEHPFLFTKQTLLYLSAECGLKIRYIDYDYINLFMTFVLDKNEISNDRLVQSDHIFSAVFNEHLEMLYESLRDAHEAIDSQNRMIDERWAVMNEMGKTIAERDVAIAVRDSVLAEKDVAIAKRDAVITEKDTTFAAVIAEHRSSLADLKRDVNVLNQKLARFLQHPIARMFGLNRE